MFIENKYFRWYKSICDNARNRTLPEDHYAEKHHVIPKSMGGSNKKENLVSLTAREHYIVHLLLVRCVEEKSVYKMMRAINYMRTKKRMQQINSRGYEKKIKTVSGFKDTEETKEKKKHACSERSKNPTYLKNLSVSLKGKKFSVSHVEALVKSRKENGTFKAENNPMYGKGPTSGSYSKDNHPFAKKVIYQNIVYPSIAELIRCTGMKRKHAYALFSQNKII
jgi:hypothetical protein